MLFDESKVGEMTTDHSRLMNSTIQPHLSIPKRRR